MLLPEPPLDASLDQLRALPVGDRRAILARLAPHERESIRARLRGTAPRRPASPFSRDIADRLASVRAGNDVSITASGKAALAQALEGAPRAQPESDSLMDTLTARLWWRP